MASVNFLSEKGMSAGGRRDRTQDLNEVKIKFASNLC